jgi:hypothetical protein
MAMSRMTKICRRLMRRGIDWAAPRRPATEASVSDRPDGDRSALREPSTDSGAEAPDPMRVELLELITGELRKSFAAAIEAGASPEELRRLLDERRKAIEERPPDADG